MQSEKKKKIWDYMILCARVLLGITFLGYGWAKLSGDQFGVSPEEMNRTIKEIGLFKLSWYLFDQQPFKCFIGVFQIITALLLLYNRTLILGALLFIPILANILIVNITYIQWPAFYLRLSYYLFLDFLILWHYKDRMIVALRAIVGGMSTKYKFNWKAYLMIPVMIVLLECFPFLINLSWRMIFHTRETIAMFDTLPGIVDHFWKWVNS